MQSQCCCRRVLERKSKEGVKPPSLPLSPSLPSQGAKARRVHRPSRLTHILRRRLLLLPLFFISSVSLSLSQGGCGGGQLNLLRSLQVHVGLFNRGSWGHFAAAANDIHIAALHTRRTSTATTTTLARVRFEDLSKIFSSSCGAEHTCAPHHRPLPLAE